MSFIPANFFPFEATFSTNTASNLTYTTDEDTLAQVTASGYFDPAASNPSLSNNVAGLLKVGDLIYIIATDGSAELTVTTLDPVTVEFSGSSMEGVVTATWSGIWAAAQSGNITYQLVDHQVLLDIPSVLANATVGASIVLDTALPLSLRPAAAKTFTLFVKDDSALVLPNLTTYTDGTVVVNTTGIINIYAGRGTTGTFAGTSVNGTSGFPGTALSYYV